MITEQDIARAETEAAEAEAKRVAADRLYAKAPAAGRAYDDLHAAIYAAEHAASKLRALREEYAQQQEALKARRAVEKAAARQLAATVVELERTRDAAVQAVSEAEAAMGRAMAALSAHDELVRGAAADLLARGLRCDGGLTGGGLDGRLIIDGETWNPVDGPGVLAQALRAVVSRGTPRHVMARMVMPAVGGPSVLRGADALLARVQARGAGR